MLCTRCIATRRELEEAKQRSISRQFVALTTDQIRSLINRLDGQPSAVVIHKGESLCQDHYTESLMETVIR